MINLVTPKKKHRSKNTHRGFAIRFIYIDEPIYGRADKWFEKEAGLYQEEIEKEALPRD